MTAASPASPTARTAACWRRRRRTPRPRYGRRAGTCRRRRTPAAAPSPGWRSHRTAGGGGGDAARACDGVGRRRRETTRADPRHGSRTCDGAQSGRKAGGRGGRGIELQLADVAARRIVRTLPTRRPADVVAFDRAGGRVVAAGAEGPSVFRTDSGEKVADIGALSPSTSAAFSPKGTRSRSPPTARDRGDGVVSFWGPGDDLERGEIRQPSPATGPVRRTSNTTSRRHTCRGAELLGAAACSATLPAGTLPAPVAGPVVCAPAPPASATASTAAASTEVPGRHRLTVSKAQRMFCLLAGERRGPRCASSFGRFSWTALRPGSGGRRLRRPRTPRTVLSRGARRAA